MTAPLAVGWHVSITLREDPGGIGDLNGHVVAFNGTALRLRHGPYPPQQQSQTVIPWANIASIEVWDVPRGSAS